jgi:hypothetical protein
MTRFKLTTVLGLVLMALLYVSPASAQATRTWVSGVGDDANPCSRTAPCKTFAGAISKTAARGEISVLDPGGFGAVTITKSISIVNDDSGEAGILASGTNGIIVNAAATDIVILRGLVIDGGTAAVPGLNGIRFLAGAALHVQKSIIKNFTSAAAGNGYGILFAPTTVGAELYVTDTTITDNGAAGNGAGIQIAPTGAGTVRVALARVQIENSTAGIRADMSNTTGTGSVVSILETVMAGNTNAGLVAGTSGVPNVAVMLDRSSIVFNNVGVIANGSSTIVRMANSTITGNATGLSSGFSGQLLSYKTNNLVGNTTEGAPTGFLVPN